MVVVADDDADHAIGVCFQYMINGSCKLVTLVALATKVRETRSGEWNARMACG